MTSPRPKQDLARPGPDESFDVSVGVQPEPAGRRVQPGPAGFPAAEAEYRKHHVRAGESFYSLAQTYYGDGQYFQALYAFNRDRVPTFDSLPAGTEILIPDIDDLPGARSTRSQPYPIGRDHDRIHVTRANQTLFEVARERLGQASRYIDLLELNRQRLPEGVHALTRLNPGVSLVLPAE